MVQEEIIKGRIAETIVRCMFEDLGFEVIPYGYEHTCPTIARKEKLIVGDVKHLIRKAPDFIVVDKDNNAYFIEVKYRFDGVYKKPTDYPYRECYIILLTPEYMGIEQYKNLNDETELKARNLFQPIDGEFRSFADVPLFKDLDKKIVRDYRSVLKRYLNKN